MPKPDKAAPTTRAIVWGVFLIPFGIALGAMAFLTFVGPIFGVILVGFGIYVIWSSSAHGEPPGPVS